MTRTYALDAPFDLEPDELRALIGGKAAGIAAMLGPDLRLPVPPGFAITTQTCREVLDAGWPAGLDDELRARMAEIEAATGRRFGDPSDPTAFNKGTTDLTVELVIKDHESVRGKKVVTLPKYIPADPKTSTRWSYP